jgi:Coenzyme PQQ synthesis protein D (PqqD)
VRVIVNAYFRKGLQGMSVRRYRINSPTAIHDTIDSEVVIINFDTGTYYSLESVGAYVWGLVEAHATTEQIADRVIELDPGRAAIIKPALVLFLCELEEEGLIVRASLEEPVENLLASAKAPGRLGGDALSSDLFTLQKFTDMNHLLLLDPIHEVDETGWPNVPADARAEERTGNAS